MSSRPYLKPFKVVLDGDMGSAVESTPVVISQITRVGFNLAWTGDAEGTFDVQVCNDMEINSQGQLDPATGSWDSLTLSNVITATGVDDTAFIDIRNISAAYIRIVFNRDTGSGTLNVTISGKC